MEFSESLPQLATDLETLYRAYETAGLFAEKAESDIARKLLGGSEDAYRFKRDFLLVDALLRNRLGRLVSGGSLSHIAVFGGNNVGKSTTVNILAGGKVAAASPEGGYTRNAHGFSLRPPRREAMLGSNPYAFTRFQPISPDQFRADPKVDHYVLVQLESWALPQDVGLWDVPDCDSTESRGYLPAVLEAVAVADVVVYVTSGERYAVANLLEWVFLLNDAGIELVECLNRTRRTDHPAVMKNQREKHFPRMAEQLGLRPPDPPIIGLRYLVEGDEHELWGVAHSEAAELRDQAIQSLRSVDRQKAGVAAVRFASRRLERLVEPVRLEVLAKQQWGEAVEAAVRDFLRIYQQKYLTSDKTVEPFTRLNIAILDLLDPDIPGLREGIRALRWVTRWPVKVVLAIGGRIFEFAQDYFRQSPAKLDAEKLPPELQVCTDAHAYVLNRLSRFIEGARAAPRHHPFWDAIGEAWKEELPALSEQLLQQVQVHMDKTEASIRQTAAEILNQLRASPVLLNTMRTVKVAANIGGVLAAFILSDGGFVYDLLEEAVIAPALVSSVEAATVASIEQFVKSRKDKLMDGLLADAKEIAVKLYRQPLTEMAELAMGKTATLGVAAELPDRLIRTLKTIAATLENDSVPS
jgi:hypothetical protein